jgi:hypothetical protein
MSILKSIALHGLWVLLLASSVITLSAQAQAPPTREYQIKAGFLFNFTQFVEWPSSAFVKAGMPIVIGVLGLFINIADPDKLEGVVASLKGRSILTVSDAASFMRQGGMIRFLTVNKKIQLQINPEATKAADLAVSSKVLRLAEIVVPDKK